MYRAEHSSTYGIFVMYSMCTEWTMDHRNKIITNTKAGKKLCERVLVMRGKAVNCRWHYKYVAWSEAVQCRMSSGGREIKAIAVAVGRGK